MSSPTSKEQRPRKRPSPTDENAKPKNYSPSKLLYSPISTVKKYLGFTPSKEGEEAAISTKKARRDNEDAFITSSPNMNLKKISSKDSANILSPVKKVTRNLNADFEAIEKVIPDDLDSSSQEDSSDEKNGKRKSLLNTLFSPFYTLLVPAKPGSTNSSLRALSEKSSPVQSIGKNELSTDETIGEISLLANESSEQIQFGVYDPYSLEQEEEEAQEEEVEFDPYLFIANLPSLQTLHTTRPRVKLPAKKDDSPALTLVLDLDETLVHCSTEPIDHAELTFPVMYGGREYQVYVRKRPHFEAFLKHVSKAFEVVVFTASQEVYASKLLDLIDPQGSYIHHRLYRDACVEVEGNYLKDLSVLGRDLSKVVIIDNSPQAFGFQLENGIPIESWFDDFADTELLKLLPFLDSLHKVEDVRPSVKQSFKLYDRVNQLRNEQLLYLS